MLTSAATIIASVLSVQILAVDVVEIGRYACMRLCSSILLNLDRFGYIISCSLRRHTIAVRSQGQDKVASEF